MDTLPHSPPTSSLSRIAHSGSAVSDRAALRRFSYPSQLPEDLDCPPSSSPPSYSATQAAGSRTRSTSLDIRAWHRSRTRRDSLEVERERRQRRATLRSTPSSSPSTAYASVSRFVLPSPLFLLHNRRRRERQWGTPSPRGSWIHQPAPIWPPNVAAFLQGEELRGPPPPPYRPHSPNEYLGFVERWEELPNPNYVAPGSAVAHIWVQDGEDVPTAEHIEYAAGFRIPWVDRRGGEEDVPTVGHVEDRSSVFPCDSRLEDMPTFKHVEFCVS